MSRRGSDPICGPAPAGASQFMEPLRFAYSVLTGIGAYWKHWVFRGARTMSAAAGPKRTVSMTIDFNEKSLWLIPAGLAILFMLWVLWNWRREERRRDRSITRLTFPDRPAPNSAVPDARRTGTIARR